MSRRTIRIAALALIAASTAIPAANAASLGIRNSSAEVIRAVHVSPAGFAEWGPDLLGLGALNPGEVLTVELEPYFCSYDVLSVNDQGESTVTANYYVC